MPYLHLYILLNPALNYLANNIARNTKLNKRKSHN